MKELRSSAIGHGDVKMVSIRIMTFVLLQYLTAPQSSFFSYSNINDGGAWKIHSLGIVIVCLPGPRGTREAAGNESASKGETQRPKNCNERSHVRES